MILITSAAYITDEFASEIGLIPPSFLPIGNKRLFEHQIELLKQLKGKIYLSLPKGYRVESGDRHILQYLNVELIFVPENLSLGESILYCWNATGYPHDTLSILHGDTLFTDINLESQDHISVHKNKGFYQRASISIDSLHSEHFSNKWAGEDETVVSGYFSFTKPAKLMKGIVENNGDFVKALEQYATEVKLKEISSGHWFDLGHLNSFFRSRSEITTQRAFNEMKITTRVVQKASSNDNKMLAESNWFDSLPNSLRIHIPQLIEPFANNSESKGSYKLEYLYLLPLSDLFVYGALSLGAWNRICDSVALVMREFSQFETKDFDLKETDKLYLPKTLDRLRNFQKQSSFDINKKLTWKKNSLISMSLTEMANFSSQYINKAKLDDIAIVHGDMCFSNILFDSRIQAVKLIDPRGLSANGNVTIWGDKRYDLAKFYHSALGLYDLIIANRFKIDVANDIYNIEFSSGINQLDLSNVIKKSIFEKSKYEESEIIAINVQLFLSMLPLHYDRPDRQQAMIANALRLTSKLVKLETLNKCL